MQISKSAPTSRDVKKAVRKASKRRRFRNKRDKIPVIYREGWDNKNNIARTSGVWNPQYVILHHTANGGAPGNQPSLGWVMNNTFKPVRACHFLIGRDGTINVIYAYGCYHAGLGGPWKSGNARSVPKNSMNNCAFGIEIESKGTKKVPTRNDANNGYTKAQVEATARLTAELQRMMKSNVKTAINHKTWAPGRKYDTTRTDKWWWKKIRPYRFPKKHAAKAK